MVEDGCSWGEARQEVHQGVLGLGLGVESEKAGVSCCAVDRKWGGYFRTGVGKCVRTRGRMSRGRGLWMDKRRVGVT